MVDNYPFAKINRNRGFRLGIATDNRRKTRRRSRSNQREQARTLERIFLQGASIGG